MGGSGWMEAHKERHLPQASFPLLDVTFTSIMFAAGSPDQEGVAPERRQGPLWDAFRALKAEGWTVDGRDYSTAFRVKPTAGKDFSGLQASASAAYWRESVLQNMCVGRRQCCKALHVKQESIPTSASCSAHASAKRQTSRWPDSKVIACSL